MVLVQLCISAMHDVVTRAQRLGWLLALRGGRRGTFAMLCVKHNHCYCGSVCNLGSHWHEHMAWWADRLRLSLPARAVLCM